MRPPATTRAGHRHPCKCRKCRDANSAYERHRYRQKAYGRWQPFTDAAPVREHVKALMAAGVGAPRVAALADVSWDSVSRLLYGEPGRGMPPTRRIRTETACRLLAVTAAEPNLSERALVDAAGTRRRIQALVTLGWSETVLAPMVRLRPKRVHQITGGWEKVTAQTARNVRALYDLLWDQVPPETTTSERLSASRARGHATRKGWAPPLAWDDDQIDNPQAEPAAGWKRKKLTTCGDLAADFAELEARHPDRVVAPERVRADIAERLGVRRGSLDRAVARAAKAAAEEQAA